MRKILRILSRKVALRRQSTDAKAAREAKAVKRLKQARKAEKRAADLMREKLLAKRATARIISTTSEGILRQETPMHEVVAMGVRHIPVYLDYDRFGPPLLITDHELRAFIGPDANGRSCNQRKPLQDLVEELLREVR